MDGGDIALIVVGVVGTITIVWAGFLLDRRSQRIASAKWMRAWTVLNRVRRELFDRLHGPLRLQDQRGDAQPRKRKRKPATSRVKRSRKQTR
ncbi:MAG: hypothetical protein JSR79_13355 [Proteobacteria bacterium]|nr:hypothetical protein [Pseudomonadota bacterium]